MAALAFATEAGAATVLPELRFETRFDDNVLHIPQGSDDWVLVLTPGLAILNRDPVTSYDMRGSMGYTNYQQTGAPNSRRDVFNGWFKHEPGRLEQLDLRAKYVQSVDPIDFISGVVTSRGNVTSAESGGTADFFRLGFSGNYNRWDYASADDNDASSFDVRGGVYVVNTEITRVAVEARHEELLVASLATLKSNFQTAVMRRKHTASLASEIEAGVVEIDDAVEGNSVKPALAFGLRRQASDAPLSWHIRIASDIERTWDVGMKLSSVGRMVEIQFEDLLDSQGGLYRTPTTTQRASIGAADTLWSGQTLEFDARYEKVRPFHGEEPKVDIWRIGAFVSTPMGPWLTGRMGWDFMRQDAPAGGTSTEFDRNRYSVAVTAGRSRW